MTYEVVYTSHLPFGSNRLYPNRLYIGVGRPVKAFYGPAPTDPDFEALLSETYEVEQ